MSSPAIEAADARGKRRYARWRAELFRRVAESALLGKDRPANDATVSAWLDLLVEGVGSGAFDERVVLQPERESLLATLVLARAPRALSRLDPARLAELWNLGEGAAAEASWVSRVLAQVVADESVSLAREELEATLADTLEALGPDAPPRMGETSAPGDHREAEVLSVRASFPRFVPGRLRLIRPRVAVVTDRCSDAELAVCVLSGQTLLTSIRGRARGHVPAPGGTLAMSPGALRIGDTRWVCRGLQHWQHVVCSPAGFAVGTCVDSQRIWVARA